MDKPMQNAQTDGHIVPIEDQPRNTPPPPSPPAASRCCPTCGRTSEATPDTNNRLDDFSELLGGDTQAHHQANLPSLLAANGLSMDDEGNIMDTDGHVVGKTKPPTRHGASDEGQRGGPNTDASRKAGSARSPDLSDLFLDVKSTTEGIQLTIRIPTVFPAAKSH